MRTVEIIPETPDEEILVSNVFHIPAHYLGDNDQHGPWAVQVQILRNGKAKVKVTEND